MILVFVENYNKRLVVLTLKLGKFHAELKLAIVVKGDPEKPSPILVLFYIFRTITDRQAGPKFGELSGEQ